MRNTPEVVILDGWNASHDGWPIQLAEAMLVDPTQWGLGEGESEHTTTQTRQFSQLAGTVTYLNRYPAGKERTLLWRIVEQNETLAHYSTQELLDALCMIYRDEHNQIGIVYQLEPRLRLIVKEVLHRIDAPFPPIFQSR